MRLFHGSNMRVTEINLSKSRPAKDFGRAFYLSSNREQAMEMAKYKVETFGGEVVVNEFDFDEASLNTLNYMHFNEYTEEWAKFVLSNRDSENLIHDYDVVYGPIANDKIGRQIFNFHSGYIDFPTFLKRIQYPEGITFQWAFCTERSINLLKSI